MGKGIRGWGGWPLTCALLGQPSLAKQAGSASAEDIQRRLAEASGESGKAYVISGLQACRSEEGGLQPVFTTDLVKEVEEGEMGDGLGGDIRIHIGSQLDTLDEVAADGSQSMEYNPVLPPKPCEQLWTFDVFQAGDEAVGGRASGAPYDAARDQGRADRVIAALRGRHEILSLQVLNSEASLSTVNRFENTSFFLILTSTFLFHSQV